MVSRDCSLFDRLHNTQPRNFVFKVYLQWGNAIDALKALNAVSLVDFLPWACQVGFWGHLQSKGFRAKSIEHSKIQIGEKLKLGIRRP